MNMSRLAVAITAAATLALAGCASSVKLDEPKNAPVENRSPLDPKGGANTGSVGNGNVKPVDLTKDTATVSTTGNTIYFDLDSYVVKDEFRTTVESQAKALGANSSKKLTVEGHTDERGGSEYNLALGQKRAQAVVKALTLLGAKESQLEAVSFGKERPAVQGSDEAAWAKNRRAELINR
ncbi:MAG: hypothetical protein RLZZ618_4217 [Pseudomonadota bacterium]|jgi:peptidoglycan-associated lipoprotein